MASGPQKMIQCGWSDCKSWFSTGVDMNQHVLINHIKFMKIEFGEPDHAVVKQKNENKVKSYDDSTMTRTAPQAPSNWIADSPRMMSSLAASSLTALPKQESMFQCSEPNSHQSPTRDREAFVHYYDVEDDGDDPDSVDAPASANPSETSQVPEEPLYRKRSNEDMDDEFEENGQDGAGFNQPAAKKTKPKSTGTSDKIPWAFIQSASHIPAPGVRLGTSYPTVARMAHAIREELSCRKTLRKKNPANGNYCVVCLDYRKDNGFCEHYHNNQHDLFVKYWHTMFGKDRISKQNLLLQLLDMQKIQDPLPPVVIL